MGEIIIKVPEDVREVIETELPYREIKKKLEELEKEKKRENALKILEKYKHSVEIEEINEEELYS